MRKIGIDRTKSAWFVTLTVVAMVASAQAGIVANWNFEDIPAGSDYGGVPIVASTSTVNGVVLTAFANNPLYVRGADGIGHATASGYLSGGTDNALYSGFAEFNFSFDARLAAAPAATQAIMRYGVTTTAWSIYTGTDSRLNMQWFDETGANFTLNTSAAVMPGDSAYHHYEIVWDGSSAQIKLDGVAQLLETGTSDTWAVSLGAVRSAGAGGQLAVGGMIRDNLTVSQEFSGFIDNVVISNTAAIPEPAALSLIGIGIAGIMWIRRIVG